MTFTEHLQEEGYTRYGILYYERQIRLFERWMEEENLSLGDITHRDLMEYIRCCRQQGNKPSVINGKLTCIGRYLSFRKTGPEHIPKVSGTMKRRIYLPIPFETLHKIYQRHPHKTASQQREKVALGLLIYQALKPKELSALSVKDISLNWWRSSVSVPFTCQGMERTLRLNSSQVRQISRYIDEDRSILLGRLHVNTDRLIVTGGKNLSDLLKHLMRRLRKTHPEIVNWHHIRISVISHWLKSHPLRQTQLMAGHRWISSTEKLMDGNVEGLQGEVERWFGRG